MAWLPCRQHFAADHPYSAQVWSWAPKWPLGTGSLKSVSTIMLQRLGHHSFFHTLYPACRLTPLLSWCRHNLKHSGHYANLAPTHCTSLTGRPYCGACPDRKRLHYQDVAIQVPCRLHSRCLFLNLYLCLSRLSPFQLS